MKHIKLSIRFSVCWFLKSLFKLRIKLGLKISKKYQIKQSHHFLRFVTILIKKDLKMQTLQLDKSFKNNYEVFLYNFTIFIN